jgi:hypothetical protein
MTADPNGCNGILSDEQTGSKRRADRQIAARFVIL